MCIRDSMNSVKEDLTPLKNLLSVEIDTNAVMIPCDPKGFPLTALDFTVATSGTKGGETTAAYELSLTGVYAGISCLINTTEKTLTFSVLPTGSIAETNLYVLTFTDNETGQKIHKRITVCGVRKGPEGNSGADGQDGKDGQDGAPGKDGNDGQDGVSTYIYVRYSPSSSGDPMSEYPTLNTKYIGVATTTSPDPPEYNNSYTWSKYVGDDAPAMYTWIRYADNAQGLNMSDSPAGKRYIGIAINQTSPTESNDPVLYSWSLIKGDTGAEDVYKRQQ